MFLSITELIFLVVWTIIGSVLGFLSFSYTPKESLTYNFIRCCLSIGIGLFISIPITIYLVEEKELSSSLSIFIGGIGAFGLPDTISRYYSIIIRRLIFIFLTKTKESKLNIHRGDNE